MSCDLPSENATIVVILVQVMLITLVIDNNNNWLTLFQNLSIRIMVSKRQRLGETDLLKYVPSMLVLQTSIKLNGVVTNTIDMCAGEKKEASDFCCGGVELFSLCCII